jgi:hypothetical protein
VYIWASLHGHSQSPGNVNALDLCCFVLGRSLAACLLVKIRLARWNFGSPSSRRDRCLFVLAYSRMDTAARIDASSDINYATRYTVLVLVLDIISSHLLESWNWNTNTSDESECKYQHRNVICSLLPQFWQFSSSTLLDLLQPTKPKEENPIDRSNRSKQQLARSRRVVIRTHAWRQPH